MSERLDENELWMLSFYRRSEIAGALFFARLANSLKPGAVQFDMTRHFADESRHAWEWTSCIARLGSEPLPIDGAYQDRYLRAAGLPANFMEVLAITHVFERRVFHHYSAHHRLPGLRAEVKEALARIMADEKWHLAWVGKALRDLEPSFGKENIGSTLKRFTEADRYVHRAFLDEHADRWRAFSRRQAANGLEQPQ
jgi:hypothetical protein